VERRLTERDMSLRDELRSIELDASDRMTRHMASIKGTEKKCQELTSNLTDLQEKHQQDFVRLDEMTSEKNENDLQFEQVLESLSDELRKSQQAASAQTAELKRKLVEEPQVAAADAAMREKRLANQPEEQAIGSVAQVLGSVELKEKQAARRVSDATYETEESISKGRKCAAELSHVRAVCMAMKYLAQAISSETEAMERKTAQDSQRLQDHAIAELNQLRSEFSDVQSEVQQQLAKAEAAAKTEQQVANNDLLKRLEAVDLALIQLKSSAKASHAALVDASSEASLKQIEGERQEVQELHQTLLDLGEQGKTIEAKKRTARKFATSRMRLLEAGLSNTRTALLRSEGVRKDIKSQFEERSADFRHETQAAVARVDDIRMSCS